MKCSFKVQCWLKRLYRRGPRFHKYMKSLEQSQFYTPVELQRYQNQALQKMINHCYQNIPYYRDLFRSLNIFPEDIQTSADLQKLPHLDKKILQENYDRLISKKHHNFLCRRSSDQMDPGYLRR